MSFLSTVANLFLPQPEVHERSSYEYPPLSEQLLAIQRLGGTRPWRAAGVPEALGVPAILGAVSLISNTVGSLALEAFRQGTLVTDREDVPRLIIRPNPLSTPRVFFRDTAFYLATRGEAWWWVAARDQRDDTPLSLYPVPPWEVVVEQNDRDRLNPKITWMNRVIPNRDMRHLTYLPGTTGRGEGPLQLAGAAVSVGVEADHWAANFFSGSLPSMVGTTDQELTEDELAALDAQWVEKPNNLPRWMTMGMTLSETPFDASKAQLTETRQHQVSEVARMFDMPGSLLEYNMPGSSLRYQNDETIWADFQRRCLSPHYLEPIEQEISDLLTRSTVARFNLDQLLRASIKTRSEVYTNFATVLGQDEAAAYLRTKEGMAAGSADFQPVPLSQPAAVPERLPFERSAHEVRCPNGHLLAELAAPPYRFTCSKCKQTASEDVHERSEATPQIVNVHPTPVTMEAPRITLPPMDMSAMNRIADESKRQNDINARNADSLAELVKREPNIYIKPSPPAEVTVHTDSFVEAVHEMKQLMAAPRTRTVIRDADDRIIGSKEEIA